MLLLQRTRWRLPAEGGSCQRASAVGSPSAAAFHLAQRFEVILLYDLPVP